jgi:tRNA (mo5U34)-methyltransferase
MTEQAGAEQAGQKAALITRADKHRWFHQIRLYDDYVTPGVDKTGAKLAALDALGLPQDLTGRRVLDIGAWDGFFSFAMERRGAEVTALDHVAKSVTGFEIAAEALNSKVTWRTQNIYQLDPAEIGTFDLVLCLGVIYHLRHVLLGLDRVRGVMRPGADLFVETAAIDNHLRLPNGQFGKLVDVAPAVREAALLQIYPHRELGNDPTNFFAPNMAGLHGLLQAAEFDVKASVIAPPQFPTRAMAWARAATHPETAFYRDRDEATLAVRSAFKPG